MQFVERSVFVCAVVSMIAGAACAREEEAPPDDELAPLVSLDSVSEVDEGTSYNGWSQSVGGTFDVCMLSADYVWHGLSRSSGDSTRGGGACAVLADPNTGACSSDAPCIASAQAVAGSTAYGYCYAGACYARWGSQADSCITSPNRAPGTIYRNMFGTHVIGCMTKTAGPNTACGGTNTSLYMRTLGPVQPTMGQYPCP